MEKTEIAILLAFIAVSALVLTTLNYLDRNQELTVSNNSQTEIETEVDIKNKKHLQTKNTRNNTEIESKISPNHKDIVKEKTALNDENNGNKNRIPKSDDLLALVEDTIDIDLDQMREDLIPELFELVATSANPRDVIKVANQLAWIGDSDSVSALIDNYLKTKEDGYPRRELLSAIAKVKNPDIAYLLNDYASMALEEKDDALLMSIADTLSNIGTEESITILKDTMVEAPSDGDAQSIVSQSIARVKNTELIPILSNIVEEQLPGYEGAMEALLNMGDFGITKIAKLMNLDENSELREKLFLVTETMKPDEKTYFALNRLAEINEEHSNTFRIASENLLRESNEINNKEDELHE